MPDDDDYINDDEDDEGDVDGGIGGLVRVRGVL